MGVGPIPWSSIQAYAREWQIHGDRFARFEHLIRAMDQEYTKIANSANDKNADSFVSITDLKGQQQMFDRLRSRANVATKKHVK